MKAIPILLRAHLLVMWVSVSFAQSDSPCNQGRDDRYDPRSPYAICLPQIGRMDDFQGRCGVFQGGGQFGNQLAAVGDVDHSGTIDLVIGHRLCDSTISVRSEELLLYKGVHGGVPMSSSGARIGPSERGSITGYLTSGDWDGDGNIDIAVRIRILDDTSGGNARGAEVSRLVVFWGNALGEYSLADTTRLESGAQMWISIRYSLGEDIDGDGVDDLLVSSGMVGLSDGNHVGLPRMLIYRGHAGGRWGRNGLARSADWQYWKPEPDLYDAIAFVDQDQDGVGDIVFGRNTEVALGGGLSILYGRHGDFPDTTEVQSISFGPSQGRYALFSDVTGDLIPELLIATGRDDVVKVYVGLKGQRLLDQYGSGNDTAVAGSDQWWGKPWATIWLPRKVNPNWFGDVDQLLDLGDINRDGVGDIAAFSWPYVVMYTGGGRLDSLVDALIDITPGTGFGILKRLGNIDGSGRDIIGLTTGNEIRFYVGTKEVSSIGVGRRLPPGTGKSSVEGAPAEDRPVVFLAARPNPSGDVMRFSWDGQRLHGRVRITMYDVMGGAVCGWDAVAEAGMVECRVAGLSAGVYVVQLRCGELIASTRVVIR